MKGENDLSTPLINFSGCITVIQEQELDDLEEKEKPFEEWHDENERGMRIAFFQGSSDKKLRNRALVAFETSFHKSYDAALLCIKVNLIFFFSKIGKHLIGNRK